MEHNQILNFFAPSKRCFGVFKKIQLQYKHTTQYSQRVERAQTLEGIRGQLWYLVVTQVSVKNKRNKKQKPESQWGREKHRKHSTEVNTNWKVAGNKSFCGWLTGCRIHASPHLLTSCAASYKEKRPQLVSPWWRSAPVVWNQTYTQTIEKRH